MIHRHVDNVGRYASQFSTHSVGRNHHANLTIIVRVNMHEYEPGHNDRMDRWLGGGRALVHGQEVFYENDDGVRCALMRWPAGEFEPFCQRFKQVVEEGWNNKLWLVPDAIWSGAIPDLSEPEMMIVPAIRCHLRVELSGNEDVHADVAYMANVGEYRRSSSPAAGPHRLARITCLDEVGVQRFKLDSNDLTPRTRMNNQIPALHEMGHYLGLDHSNRQGVSFWNSNSPEAYNDRPYRKGDSPEERGLSLMGRGSDIRPAHAWPWKNRLQHHVPMARHISWHGVTRRPRPQLMRRHAETNQQSGGSDNVGTPQSIPDGGVAVRASTRGPGYPGPVGRLA